MDESVPQKLLSNGLYKLRARETLSLKNPRTFFKDFYCNKSIVSRLEFAKELKKHTGCVNTVHWSQCGRYLVSGSDDTRLCVWDYHKNGELVTSWHTGHTANIFSARFMPQTNLSRVISCAGDSEVRAFQIDVAGKAFQKKTHAYTCHTASVKRLVTWENDPNNFMSCSEDGTVRLFDLREPATVGGKICVDLSRSSMDINSIDLCGNNFCIGGGDPIVRVYDFRKLNLEPNQGYKNRPFATYAPYHLVQDLPRGSFSYKGHITGVAFHGNDIIATYSGDSVYLFRMGETKEYSTSLSRGLRARNGDDKDSTDKASDDDDDDDETDYKKIPSKRSGNEMEGDSSDDLGALEDEFGKEQYYDFVDVDSDCTDDTSTDISQKGDLKKKDGDKMEIDSEPAPVTTTSSTSSSAPVTTTSETPSETTTIISPNIDLSGSNATNMESKKSPTESESMEEDLIVKDMEVPQKKKSGTKKRKTGHEEDKEENEGKKKTRREPLPEDHQINPRDYYKQKYTGHCNIQTVKSVSFFGPRAEYVVSGSDDGNIFIWEKETGELVNLMHGDRHVVNIMVGHPFDPVMATSGIENHVKLWQPILPVPRDLTNAQQVYARNQSRVDASADRPTIPIALIRRLIQTGALQVVAPRGRRAQADDEVDGENNANNNGEDENDDDDQGVECRIA